MENNFIGKVLFAGAVMLLIAGITALLNAKGEGPRRIRLLLGGLIILGLLALVLEAAGPGGLALVVVVIGAITWIVRGFKG